MHLLSVAQETCDQSKIADVIAAKNEVETLYSKAKSTEENCKRKNYFSSSLFIYLFQMYTSNRFRSLYPARSIQNFVWRNR
jgi:hypothetical protein